MDRHIPDQLLPLPEWRWAARSRFGPAGVAIAAALVMIASHFVYAAIMGHDIYNPDEAALVPVETSAWAAFISSVLTSTGFWLQMTAPRRMFGTIAQLPYAASTHPREELLKVAASAFSGRERLARRSGIGGFVTGVLFGVFGILNSIPDHVYDQRWEYTGWFLIFVPFQFAIIGRATAFMYIGNKAMRDWANEHMVVDPLNPDALRPLARVALRGAGEWFVILTVGMLILLGQTLEPLLMGPLYVAGFGFGIAAFVAPMRQANEMLASAKQAALSEVSAAIAKERGLIDAGGAEGGAAGQRLAGLIAYRSALLDAREWPVDIGILARLIIYMAFPVVGWIGSALVQNALESTVL